MRNTARLIQLADHLRDNVTDAQFDPTTWFSYQDYEEIPIKSYFTKHPDGKACAGGHAIVLFGWARGMKGDCGDSVRQTFALEHDDYSAIFLQSATKSPPISRLQFAATIEHFANTGEVNWDIRDPKVGDIVTIRAKVVGLKDHDGDLQLEPLEESMNGSFYFPADQIEKIEPRAEPKVGDRVKWKEDYDNWEGVVLFIDGDFAFIRPDEGEHQSIEVQNLMII